MSIIGKKHISTGEQKPLPNVYTTYYISQYYSTWSLWQVCKAGREDTQVLLIFLETEVQNVSVT